MTTDVTETIRDFDPDELREKYRLERDKRLRDDGNQQYVEIKGEFAHYLEDPYVEPIVREPVTDEVDVVVIGGGFGGLLTGARLRDKGVQSLRMIEKGGDFGGTWYWNRYPGAMCDTEAYIYLPLLEEVGYVPTEKYAHAPEILLHSKNIAGHYDLYRDALLQTEVTEMRWDDQDQRWVIGTNRNDAIRARYVVMANGPLHRPKLPGIPGLTDFEGHTFHTSRWDYEYTGGTNEGGLVNLQDKVVGIIGTGATAVQAIPHLGEWSKHLYVFQRTPSSIDVRGNRPTDPDWAATLEPGWQRRRMDNFNTLTSGGYEPEDLVNDGWTDIIGKMIRMMMESQKEGLSPQQLGQMMELADFEKMEQIRARVEQLVEDAEVAESLKPWYRQFCKRPCFHDEYLDTYNRPNVTMVDTGGKGVERITAKGVVVDGVEYELDCIVYATGFEVGTSYTRRAGYELYGRDGISLSEYWADGVRTLHGFHVRNFPNCFIISGAQSAMTVNFPHMLDVQSTHLAYIIGQALDEGARVVEVSEKAEEEWVHTIIESANANLRFSQECTPGYYNNEGQPVAAGQNGPYGKGANAMIKVLEDWRAEGDLRGLELVT